MKITEISKKYLEKGGLIRRRAWDSGVSIGLTASKSIFIYYKNSKLYKPVSFFSGMVQDIMADDWEVVKKPEKSKNKVWKPNIGENYFFITSSLEVNKFTNEGNTVDESIISSDNCFKTKEEAQHMIDKLKVIKELQDLSNIKLNMSNFKNNKIYFIAYDFTENRIVPLFNNICRSIPFNVYFPTKEDCERAIEEIGEDRIKKYYFDIED